MTGGRNPGATGKGQIVLPRGESAIPDEESDETAGLVSILPEGAYAWQQLFRTPLRFVPWPYLDAELSAIESALPESHSGDCLELVLVAARYFVAGTRDKKSRPPKPNPRKELKQIVDAARDLREAVRAASLEARQHLANKLQAPALPEDKWQTLDELSFAVDTFLHDNRYALRVLPVVPRGGPARKLADEAVVFRFWRAWNLGHGGAAPARGWPTFLQLCADPLVKFGLASRSQKAWQDVLSQAKKRARKAGMTGAKSPS